MRIFKRHAVDRIRSDVRRFTGNIFAGTVLPAVMFLCIPAFAEEPGPGTVNHGELESFFDEYLTARMAEYNIAGAAVSVVENGRVVLSKGYGYADAELRIPVDPENTQFILGSLSKVFTWTAVMQLVERGQLDLDADVNEYLYFMIPRSGSRPVTVRDLMNHTAGFEDIKYGQMAASADGLMPLGAWLASHIPARIRPAGLFSGYGNYAAALAGYIVERNSGMSYDEYIDRFILIPWE